jgi:DedD protein
MDEKLKHRLVGVSVVLSLGAIFLPAMMKKSSQHLESNFSVNVQLPPKPAVPNVAVADEEQMFKTIKVAKIEPASSASKKAKTEDFVAKAPIKDDTIIAFSKVEPVPQSIKRPSIHALNKAVKHEIKVASIGPIDPIKPIIPVKPVKPVLPAKVEVAKAALALTRSVNPAAKKDIYAVQLASFAKISNAEALVHKLQQKGYKANYVRVAGKKAVIYKVYVGHSPIKDNVVKLRTQLASAMQLNGFVVNTGVS